MGQRHQILLHSPPMWADKKWAKNPNQKPERIEAIHHQWLYGKTAIRLLANALEFMSVVGKQEGKEYLFGLNDPDGYTGGDGINALAAIYSIDIERGYYHNTHVLYTEWKPEGVSVPYVTPKQCDPDHFDNNDGITLISVDGNQIRYAFITPNHLEGEFYTDDLYGKGEKGPWTAEEYLSYYYKKSDWSKDTLADLKRIAKFARPMTKAEVKKILPNFFKTKGKKK